MASKEGQIGETVFRDLLRKILDGYYEAGSRLPPERELASLYSTNRNTLREAIRRLEQANLVTARQGQGITVMDYRKHGSVDLLGHFLLDSSQHEEKLEVLADLLLLRRWVLESAVNLAADRAKNDDTAALREIADDLKTSYAAEDHKALMRGDIAFVNAIVDAAHSLAVRWVANTLIGVYARFAESANAFWIMEPSFPEYLETVCTSISQGDGPKAAQGARDYFDRVDARLMEIIEKLKGHSGQGGQA